MAKRWRRELEGLRQDVEEMPHSPACPGVQGCWCPVGVFLALINGRLADD